MDHALGWTHGGQQCLLFEGKERFVSERDIGGKAINPSFESLAKRFFPPKHARHECQPLRGNVAWSIAQRGRVLYGFRAWCVGRVYDVLLGLPPSMGHRRRSNLQRQTTVTITGCVRYC